MQAIIMCSHGVFHSHSPVLCLTVIELRSFEMSQCLQHVLISIQGIRMLSQCSEAIAYETDRSSIHPVVVAIEALKHAHELHQLVLTLRVLLASHMSLSDVKCKRQDTRIVFVFTCRLFPQSLQKAKGFVEVMHVA